MNSLRDERAGLPGSEQPGRLEPEATQNVLLRPWAARAGPLRIACRCQAVETHAHVGGPSTMTSPSSPSNARVRDKPTVTRRLPLVPGGPVTGIRDPHGSRG